MADCFDLCVIGAGSAGLTVAAAAAQFGERVVLIERGKMGGDCLNYGCVPSKALIAAANHAHAVVAGKPFGIAAAKPEVDFAKVYDHVHGVIAAIAPHDSQERFERLGVKVIRAAGRFTDPGTVEAGGASIRARRFVIATGSSPAVPAIPGLGEVAFDTNETIFDHRTRPGRLIVIGAGSIGLELAQAHRRLGSEVVVIEAFEPLAREDPELVRVMLDRLVAEGVTIKARTRVLRVDGRGKELEVEIEHAGKTGRIGGDRLLVATGRKPNIEGLGLDVAGIEHSPRGITVDQGLRTTNRKVYAIGDVVGGLQFTHVAAWHAGLVLRSALFRLPVRASTDHIPRVTFTDPELVQVGLTEAEACKRGGQIDVLRWPFGDNDRAQAERRTEGLIKVVVGRRGRIVGAGIVGAHAGELIQPWGLAITSRLAIRSMVDMVVAYPTLSDITRRVAITRFAGLATDPWIRRLISVLKWFG